MEVDYIFVWVDHRRKVKSTHTDWPRWRCELVWYEFPMDPLWAAAGPPGGAGWGFPMDPLWPPYGPPMDPLLTPY